MRQPPMNPSPFPSFPSFFPSPSRTKGGKERINKGERATMKEAKSADEWGQKGGEIYWRKTMNWIEGKWIGDNGLGLSLPFPE
jgi:hypothetical protein